MATTILSVLLSNHDQRRIKHAAKARRLSMSALVQEILASAVDAGTGVGKTKLRSYSVDPVLLAQAKEVAKARRVHLSTLIREGVAALPDVGEPGEEDL